MIFVRESHWGYDTLELIKKKDSKPVVVSTLPCAFVSVVRKKNPALKAGSLKPRNHL